MTAELPQPQDPGEPEGKYIRIIKLILSSQVGGWFMACLVFAVVAKWVLDDRAKTYDQLKVVTTSLIEEIRRGKPEMMKLLDRAEAVMDKNSENMDRSRQLLEDIAPRIKNIENQVDHEYKQDQNQNRL
jgi:hypothetical protein